MYIFFKIIFILINCVFDHFYAQNASIDMLKVDFLFPPSYIVPAVAESSFREYARHTQL